MPTHTTIEFDDLLLEGDVHALVEKLTEIEEHIYKSIPNEVLLLPSGEPNVRTRWGAVYFHTRMARASLRAFL